MKKLFIVMAAIISMMLVIGQPIFINPLSVHAEGVYVSKENLNSDYVNYHYVYVCGTKDNKYYSYLLIFDTYDESSAIINESQIYLTNIKLNNSGGSYNFKYYPFNNINDVSTGLGELSSINFNAESTTQYYQSSYNWTNFTIEILESDLIDTGLANSIVVDFNPDLENNVFRAPLPDNGVTDYSKYFTMDITNNSRTGIQYFFAIQEFPTQRTNINDYIPHPARAFCINTYNEQVYANEEWVYVHPFSANGIVKVLKPSHWHYIAAGESIHQDFSWSQYNLEKGKQYQVVVFAVKNEIGCASALNTYYNGDFGESETTPYVIDYSEAECVYYSSFTISNPVTYDPNDNKFGNYISSGDKSDVACYETKAYEDPSTGNVIIANRSTAGQDFEDVLGAPVSGGSHGGGGYYTGSSYNSGSVSGSSYNYSGSSFSSLNGYFSSFFAFITAVLNCFPSPYVVIITAGLSGLVVLGLIKVAIK